MKAAAVPASAPYDKWPEPVTPPYSVPPQTSSLLAQNSRRFGTLVIGESDFSASPNRTTVKFYQHHTQHTSDIAEWQKRLS